MISVLLKSSALRYPLDVIHIYSFLSSLPTSSSQYMAFDIIQFIIEGASLKNIWTHPTCKCITLLSIHWSLCGTWMHEIVLHDTLRRVLKSARNTWYQTIFTFINFRTILRNSWQLIYVSIKVLPYIFMYYADLIP